jgi:hypothetical protein
MKAKHMTPQDRYREGRRKAKYGIVANVRAALRFGLPGIALIVALVMSSVSDGVVIMWTFPW